MLTEVTPASETAPEVRTYRVLIIDDDPIARANYLRYLRNDAQHAYIAVEAATATDGAKCLDDHAFDCVILDYHLPGADGLTVLQALRDGGIASPEMPVIMMTGQGSEQVVVAALRLGAADYLSKDGLTSFAFQRAVNNAIDKSSLRIALRHKSAHLEQANEELRLRAAELQRFYHTVSHELKSPLTAVREFVCLVRDGVEGAAEEAERKLLLDYALSACDLMSLQVNDLMEVARSEADRVTIRKARTSLPRIAQFAVAALRHTALARGVDLTLSASSDLPDVYADEGRVAQILNNLLSNALKFTPVGGNVHVDVRRDEGNPGLVSVAVTDNGCGIPQADLPHVCERLYQVHDADATHHHGGLGLGLYIVDDLVARHGGTLSIRSEVGVGSTFSFTLPIAHSDAAASAAA